MEGVGRGGTSRRLNGLPPCGSAAGGSPGAERRAVGRFEAEPACLPVHLSSRFVLVAALALLAASAHAQDETARHLADLRLATAVRVALATDARTRALDVDVSAAEGVVTLVGLDSIRQRLAADVARGVPGVVVVAGDLPGGAPTSSVPVAAPVAEPVTIGREPPAPQRPALRESGDVAYHTVATGETLFSLARRYGTTVEAVMRLNGMEDGQIQVGQRLRMR